MLRQLRSAIGKISDYGPDSDELNLNGLRAKDFLESGGKLEPGDVGTLVEIVSKGDLFHVVSWQQPNLLAGELEEGMRSSSGS